MTADDQANSPALPRLTPRDADSHKGDFGRAVLIGGSRGMAGAISLAGMAALRSGAGLVTLAVPDVCLDTVASFEPSYMTMPLPCDDEGVIADSARESIARIAQLATCIACGPGIGRTGGVAELVCWLHTTIAAPIVFDADALLPLAARPDVFVRPAGPRIITPHPGEFRRFVSGEDTDRDALLSRASQVAGDNHCVVVLKGHGTLVTDGTRKTVNQTGNPGMSTGGAGDVLTGVITALICQGFEPFEAAQLGVHIHGLAGDLAARELGQVSLIASDLLRFLPTAFSKLDAS